MQVNHAGNGTSGVRAITRLGGMAKRWDFELEPEVLEWVHALPPSQHRVVERQADRLADAPTALGDPYTRHLGGSLRELRFVLGNEPVRLTYWLAPGRRIVFLTVFRRARLREEDQIRRARQKQKECGTEHPRSRRSVIAWTRTDAGGGRGYHGSWRIPDEHRADPAYVEAGAAVALGQAVYDRRTQLGLSPAELAVRAGLSEADIECIEGGAIAPAVSSLRTLTTALDARLDLRIVSDMTTVEFITRAV